MKHYCHLGMEFSLLWEECAIKIPDSSVAFYLTGASLGSELFLGIVYRMNTRVKYIKYEIDNALIYLDAEEAVCSDSL